MMFIAACGSSGNDTATNNTGGSAETQTDTPADDSADTGAPKQGGNLIIGVTGDPAALNPMYAGDRVTLTIDQSLYAPLFQINNGEKTFYLAESLTPSDDFLTYTLKLKPGLTWHDGEKLTADDVVFTFDSILDEKQHSFFRSMFVYNGKPLEVKKIDETTVEFKLPEVTAAFEGALVQITPIPKHIFEGVADIEKSEKNNEPVGSGPFKFKEYKPGEYLTLERFDNYFAGPAHLDSVTYRVAKDSNAANLALQNGEINLKMVDPQDFNKINATQQFNMITYAEGRLAYMVFNQNIEALQKKEVRQAIAYALNKEELIQASYTSLDFADPAPSVFTPDTLYQTGDVEAYDYDLDKAKELLAQAGVSNLKLRLAYINSNKPQQSQALYIQQKLKDVGIEVELLALDPAAFSQKSTDPNNKDYDLSLGGYIMGYEPDGYKSLFMSEEAYNFAHYKNAAFDELWNKAAVEMDPVKREDLYKQIQQTVASEMTYYPIAYTKSIIALSNQFGGSEEAVTKPVVMFEDLSKLYLK
nr:MULTISPECIES: ABC transporter substrate-binding protein [unclassified Paenibacillus]